jgi:hypothetical protein
VFRRRRILVLACILSVALLIGDAISNASRHNDARPSTAAGNPAATAATAQLGRRPKLTVAIDRVYFEKAVATLRRRSGPTSDLPAGSTHKIRRRPGSLRSRVRRPR